MIHIEELGIGNSVYLKDKVITIIDIISSESNPCIYYEDSNKLPTGIAIDEIAGIPLPNQNINDMLNDDFSIYGLKAQIEDNSVDFFNDKNERVGFTQIKYVHQLQNMYRASTGFTKTLDYDANTQSLSCRTL